MTYLLPSRIPWRVIGIALSSFCSRTLVRGHVHPPRGLAEGQPLGQ